MVTSGGGAMNLVHSLAEGSASRVRWLALVGEPPRDQQGQGAFQDTSGRAGSVDALAVYRALTPDCVRLREPAELWGWLERLGSPHPDELPRPLVLLLAKDIQRADFDRAVDLLVQVLTRLDAAKVTELASFAP